MPTIAPEIAKAMVPMIYRTNRICMTLSSRKGNIRREYNTKRNTWVGKENAYFDVENIGKSMYNICDLRFPGKAPVLPREKRTQK